MLQSDCDNSGNSIVAQCFEGIEVTISSEVIHKFSGYKTTSGTMSWAMELETERPYLMSYFIIFRFACVSLSLVWHRWS